MKLGQGHQTRPRMLDAIMNRDWRKDHGLDGSPEPFTPEWMTKDADPLAWAKIASEPTSEADKGYPQ